MPSLAYSRWPRRRTTTLSVPSYTIDDFHPDNLEPSSRNIGDYLRERGFREEIATSITLHAILKFALLPTDLIDRAAADLGYDVPASTLPLPAQHRN